MYASVRIDTALQRESWEVVVFVRDRERQTRVIGILSCSQIHVEEVMHALAHVDLRIQNTNTVYETQIQFSETQIQFCKTQIQFFKTQIQF